MTTLIVWVYMCQFTELTPPPTPQKNKTTKNKTTKNNKLLLLFAYYFRAHKVIVIEAKFNIFSTSLKGNGKSACIYISVRKNYHTGTDSDSPYACTKYHPGLCFPLMHFVMSNDYARGQRRSWSDCADAQADLGLHCPNMPEKKFLHGAAHI